MAASLKIIATPIGNMRDITLRAVDELKAADVILAEDTRHTGQLLRALGLTLKDQVRLISCYAQREEERAALVLSCLQKNERVVLVSDAGCPGISDPGSLLAQAVIEGAGSIEVIPGPSAVTAALMGAGIDVTRFSFLGFLPKRTKERHKLILSSAGAHLALVIYEAPSRLVALLEELFLLLGPRRVVVARELTKVFETFHRGTLGAELAPPLVLKGECVVVVERGLMAATMAEKEEHGLRDLIVEELDQGSTAKDIVKSLVSRFPMKKKAALTLVLGVIKERDHS